MKNRILEWRIKRGLTLEQLAEKTDKSVSMISRLQSGQRSLDIEWMEILSVALDCRPIDLLPVAWNSPLLNEIDYEILGLAIEKLVEARSVVNGVEKPREPLLTTQDCRAIGILYNKILKESRVLKGQITTLHKEVDK